jgi:hypothetical protein
VFDTVACFQAKLMEGMRSELAMARQEKAMEQATASSRGSQIADMQVSAKPVSGQHQTHNFCLHGFVVVHLSHEESGHDHK